jgi:dihydrodipicolinate synthase/N-acetylneuraminate lyase
METHSISGVFAVPPLARRTTSDRSIDFEQNEVIVRHIVQGGITRLLYGGNAFLYHVSLRDFESLLEWLSGFEVALWPIPSIGPSFGRAMEQAQLLSKHKFPCAMVLPSGDPRDAAGLERGLREIASTAGMPLVLYLKDEPNFGSDLEAGLDVVARLVDEGICTWIKYAVVRDDPRVDPYLDSLLRRVPRKRVISGIGERPAIVHMREWKLPGFTTGSGCLAPSLSQQIYDDCVGGRYGNASATRELFLPHEDLRDAWGPARVLHHATELSGLANTGPIIPYVSPLGEAQLEELAPVAKALVAAGSTLKASR